MTRTDGSTSANDVAEALLADFLERYHEAGADPEAELFAAHPEHAATLRRWWERLVATGAVRKSAPAGERFGPFVLLRQLGQGAQGTVHLADDTRLGRTVALKVLPLHRLGREQAKSRFRREAEMASRLQHPAICTVFEAGEHEGTAFIAMQYVAGRTLAEHMAAARAAETPLAIDFVLNFVEQSARALQVAHDAGLVHRDIKPGNLMVADGGRPVVLDFGLARDEEDASDLTQTGDVIGTPSYMSPEQLHGSRFPVDGRTDVYSLGVTLFECLTGRRPFAAPTQQALMQQILLATAPDPRQWRPEISRDLVVVLATALAKNREHRYASAAAFAEDLRRLRSREPVLARAIGPLHRLWRWGQSRPTLAASLLLTAVSLLAGAIVSFALYIELKSAHAAYVSLADTPRLRDVERQALRLPPAGPENVAVLEAWLTHHARPLASRLPQHRLALAALERLAVTADPDPPPSEVTGDDREGEQHLQDMRERLEDLRRAEATTERNGRLQALAMNRARIARMEREVDKQEAAIGNRQRVVFTDPEVGFRHEELAELVQLLERFTGPGGMLAMIEARLAWSTDMVRVTVHEQAAAWHTASAEVAADPRYGGRSLAPQPGLVPLGPDPSSRLQEFAFAAAGGVPHRDPTSGELALAADSAPVFVLVPPGTIGPIGERTADEDEPTRSIELDWYFVGKHELTRAQWRRLGGDHRQLFPDDVLGADADMHPATDIPWFGGRDTLARHGLQLPTEAQWEFAARGGTVSPHSTGVDPANLRMAANLRDEGEDGFLLTAPVHVLRANGFGLHHVHGNVAEWCTDPEQRSGNRSELRNGGARNRPVRGGSFAAAPPQGRAGSRGTRNASVGYPYVGLRPVRPVTGR